MTSTPKSGVAAVRAFIADAKPVARRFTGDPKPGEPREGLSPGDWRNGHESELGLPPECPVKPLGVDGSLVWCIDTIGQLQSIVPPYGKGHILGLFGGRAGYLSWAWPRFGKGGKVDGYAAEEVAASLVHAAMALGPWSAVERVRGRGLWLDARGGLIVHDGSRMLTDGREMPPGEVDGYVYPTRPALPGPWPGPIEARENPAVLLRQLLGTWSWARPDVDPHLLLGWIGASFLGAALPWRATVYITGDKASGKSTLQTLIKGVLGDRLIQAADTSAAGIYQRVGLDCLPVAVDELEGEADVKKQKAVLKLARLAASGGLMLRGGDRHIGVEFQARSCFLFSSINTPPLEPQDLSRMAILRLHRLPAGQAAPDLDMLELPLVGRVILRRLIEEWPRFRQTWDAFKGELARAGMDGRGQDTFGTLLACADMIEHAGWNEDRLSVARDGEMVPWSDLMAIGGMIEFEDAQENWRLCLNHLLSVPVDAWRDRNTSTIGQVLERFWTTDASAEPDPLNEANKALSFCGLRIIKKSAVEHWLAVPNQNPSTRKLFDGSKWAGEPGASVWAGALRQAPRGEVYDVGQCRINGYKAKVTLINLMALYGPKGIMAEDNAAEPATAPSPDPMLQAD